jgi:hypothetical protein
VRRLTVIPREVHLVGADGSGDLRVTAEFADGSREDVTAFCTFRCGDETVAEVNASGRVRGRLPGVALAVAGYGGAWATAEVLVPRPTPADFVYPELPADNVIDRVVLGRLRKLNVVASPPCTDGKFLRRAMIDVTGSLPTADEVRRFLADGRADKRARKIEELLAHPRHAALWASKFCDWTACDIEALEEPDDLRPARARMWHHWFRKRLQENVPYDRMVRGVLCGTTRGGQDLSGWMAAEAARLDAARARGAEPGYAEKPFLDLYWRRLDGTGPVASERMAELTAAAFLGLRLQCAQCHRHPADRWTQADYRAFTNVFARVRFGQSPELRDAFVDLLEARRAAGAGARPLPHLQEMYLEAGTDRYLADPVSGRPLPPRPPGGPALDDKGDAREELAAWMLPPTTRTSRGTLPTGSGSITSAGGWSSRPTTSPTPGRRTSPNCSTPSPPSSSAAASTCADWSGWSSARGHTSGPVSRMRPTRRTNPAWPASGRGGRWRRWWPTCCTTPAGLLRTTARTCRPGCGRWRWRPAGRGTRCWAAWPRPSAARRGGSFATASAAPSRSWPRACCS